MKYYQNYIKINFFDCRFLGKNLNRILIGFTRIRFTDSRVVGGSPEWDTNRIIQRLFLSLRIFGNTRVGKYFKY